MGYKGVNFKKTANGYEGGTCTGKVGKSIVTKITELEPYNTSNDFIDKKTDIFSRYDYVKDEVSFNGKKVNSKKELIDEINKI